MMDLVKAIRRATADGFLVEFSRNAQDQTLILTLFTGNRQKAVGISCDDHDFDRDPSGAADRLGDCLEMTRRVNQEHAATRGDIDKSDPWAHGSGECVPHEGRPA